MASLDEAFKLQFTDGNTGKSKYLPGVVTIKNDTDKSKEKNYVSNSAIFGNRLLFVLSFSFFGWWTIPAESTIATQQQTDIGDMSDICQPGEVITITKMGDTKEEREKNFAAPMATRNAEVLRNVDDATKIKLERGNRSDAYEEINRIRSLPIDKSLIAEQKYSKELLKSAKDKELKKSANIDKDIKDNEILRRIVYDEMIDDIDAKVEEKVDTEVEEKAEEKVDTGVEEKAEEKVDTEVEEKVDTEVEEIVDTEVEEKVDNQ